MQKYETIFVIDSLLKSEEIEAIVSKYEKFISANGGKIDVIEHWGKKRLAYEIKKRQYGYYVLIRYDGPGTINKQLEREYRLNESILRYMTLRLNKQALKMLEKQQRSATPVSKEISTETLKTEKEDQEGSAAETDHSQTAALSEESDKPDESSDKQPEAEGEPESEVKTETDSALAEEPPLATAKAVEDRTKTE